MSDRRVLPIGSTSQGAVLDIIRADGPISRVELAERTGLTQATMTTVVRQLLRDELVIEAGFGESRGGKPRALLDLNASGRFAVGIQLGSDSVVYVVTDLGGAIVGRMRTSGVGSSDPDDVLPTLVDRIESLFSTLGIDRSRVVGLGLVAPGPLDLDAGVILGPPTLSRWVAFPIRDRLAAATGLPVVLDNDATAAAIGEFWGGSAARSVSHATIYMGAGIGAGIVLSGTVFRGASSNAGEIGQTLIDSPDGGATRCTLESVAAPAAIVDEARRMPPADAMIALSPHGDTFADFAVIATAAARGHDAALRLVLDSAERLASVIVTMANLFDLDSVALAGPSFVSTGPIYLTVIARRLEQDFFAKERHPVTVRLSTHVEDAAAVGAATLILQQTLAPRGGQKPPRRAGATGA